MVTEKPLDCTICPEIVRVGCCWAVFCVLGVVLVLLLLLECFCGVACGVVGWVGLFWYVVFRILG